MGDAPISNIDYPGRFVLTGEGARAACSLAYGDPVGVFAYRDCWGLVETTSRDLAPWVRHVDERDASCGLLRVARGDRWLLVVRRREGIAAGELITADYRDGEWWAWRPLANTALPSPPPTLFFVARSAIHGRGVFSARDLERGDEVGEAIRFQWLVCPIFTRELVRYVNHSGRPTARLRWSAPRGAWMLATVRHVPRNTELTIDYRDTPWYVAKPPREWK